MQLLNGRTVGASGDGLPALIQNVAPNAKWTLCIIAAAQRQTTRVVGKRKQFKAAARQTSPLPGGQDYLLHQKAKHVGDTETWPRQHRLI